MANVAAGTVWNLPQYAGQLFTASPLQTPFLSMIGGLSGGGLQTDNFQFPTASTYAHETAAQPAITETASLTAPTAISYVRDQATNVTQIFHEKVSISYARLSNQGRLSGLNTAGARGNVTDEKDFQIATQLEKIARDIEFTCLQGVYALAANAGQANKTRGMNALCTVNTVAAGGAALAISHINELMRTMATNGAQFSNMVMFCGAFQKQAVSEIYAYAPADRNVGGYNIKQIETDFCMLGVQWNPFQAAGTILVADMSGVEPVFQPVPEKGNFFYEELSKTGAAEEGQIFGQFGLAHGPSFLHGTITGLATS
jgi:hypothetical protein